MAYVNFQRPDFRTCHRVRCAPGMLLLASLTARLPLLTLPSHLPRLRVNLPFPLPVHLPSRPRPSLTVPLPPARPTHTPDSCALAAFHSSAGLKGMWGAVWCTTVKVDIQKW